MRPHQWLGVPRLSGARFDARPLAYVAAAAVVLLVAVAAMGAAPRETMAVEIAVPRAAAARPVAVAMARVAGGATRAEVVAVEEAAEPAISMELIEDAEPAPDGPAHARRYRSDAGILGAPGLDDAIARTAGHANLGGGMAAVSREARASGWEAVTNDSCPRCFGTSLRTTKRDCVFGEHLDEHGKCVPDDP